MKRFSILLILLLTISLIEPTQTVNAASAKLNKTNATMSVGKFLTLKLTGTLEVPEWSSSNKLIATVNSKGVVKAIKKGHVIITATLDNNEYICKLIVTEKLINVTVDAYYYFDGVGYINYLAGSGIKCTVTDDGLTFTMTPSQQKALLEYLQDAFDKRFLSECPAYYISIDRNDSFTTFIARVDAAKFKSNKDSDADSDTVFLNLLSYSMGYQNFAGAKKMAFSFKIVDNKTGKTLKTVVP